MGSNPTLSASKFRISEFGLRILKSGKNPQAMKAKTFQKMIVVSVLSTLAMSGAIAGQSHTKRQPRRASICGNPTTACKTSATFQPNDLPFRVPENSVIFDTELFYAIVLRSIPANEDDCNTFIAETERLQTQTLFPQNKVFTSRCVDVENLFYTNVNPKYRIMAVYGGITLAEAKRVLDAVQATGKFPGANLRRMRTGFNGT